jgi:hypothetical protein
MEDPPRKPDGREVIDFIMRCRMDEGIPMFKHEFAGKPIYGERAVLAVCWSGHNGATSEIIDDIPEDMLKTIKEERGVWRKILEKYAPDKLEEAESYGIYIKGYKLPRKR